MSRTVDQNIKEEILNKVLQAISQKGLNNLSLRDIAKEVGIAARMLIYHFKSYDLLINAVIIKLSKDHKSALKTILMENSDKKMNELFKIFVDKIYIEKNGNTLVLFLELYTKAIRDTKTYSGFLQEVLGNWIDEVEVLIAPKYKEQAKLYATMIVAFYRGLLLDWLATGDKERMIETNKVFTDLFNK